MNHAADRAATGFFNSLLGCSYKTAFVLEGKLRESIALSRRKRLLEGVIEVDGTEIGGHSRKTNMKVGGKARRAGPPSELKVIVGLRERRPNGETRVTVVDRHELNYRDHEGEVDFIRDNVRPLSQMISDEGFSLGYIGPHNTVKHRQGFKIDDVHTNGIEGLFARIKRAEGGVHYRMVGPYLDLYAAEMSWREDFRRTPNGEQWQMLLGAVAKAPVSRRWSGYWQRWQSPDANRRRRP